MRANDGHSGARASLRPRTSGLVGCLITAALICFASAGPAEAATCNYTWKGGDGAWSDASDWTTSGGATGVPGTDASYASESVCITASGTYTVTLTPFSYNGTGYPQGVQIGSLTLGGGSSGTQTLEIEGEASVDRNNETTNDVGLDLASGSSEIAVSGAVVLDATTLGTGVGGPDGGSASLTAENAATITNSGSITSESDTASVPADVQWLNYLGNGNGATTVTNDGQITVQSGTLQLPPPNNGGVGYCNATTVQNNGTFTVASGATLNLSGNCLDSSAAFDNAGAFVNSGTTNLLGGGTWNQSTVNSMSGNLVQVQGGGQVIDSSSAAGVPTSTAATGNGGFKYIVGGGYLTGTIPAGQTVDVQGTTFNNAGNNDQSTYLTLGGPNGTYTDPVVNHGTVRLDADGSGTTSGGQAIINGIGAKNIEFDNYGTFESTVEDSNYANALQVLPFVNEAGGTVDVAGGDLYQNAGYGTNTVNDGTVEIAPGSDWFVVGGSFTNAGTFAPAIASATSFGTMTLEGTLLGQSAFNAGGTIAPALVGGYTPPTGTDFPVIAYNGGSLGTSRFATAGGGFAVDYGHETTSPAYVGVIYGTSGSGTSGNSVSGSGTSGSGSVGPTLALRSISASGATILAALSCSSGDCAYRLNGTVTEHRHHGKIVAVTARAKSPGKQTVVVTVARASGTIVAGSKAPIRLSLNGTGQRLLRRLHRLSVAVTLSTSNGTHTYDVTLKEPSKAQKKH